MAPVHHPGNNDAIDIIENFLERFPFIGSALRNLRANGARFVIRRNSQLFDVFAEIRNPICDFMQLSAKFLGRRIAELLFLLILHGVSFINTPL